MRYTLRWLNIYIFWTEITLPPCTSTTSVFPVSGGENGIDIKLLLPKALTADISVVSESVISSSTTS